ncbi:MAG TPA: aminotransferase class IV [Bdellovibrionota bacterium]|jgi:branched-chain amino acid aminotransferase|nr:aminotransferase class IV [Bdellovibrionota bacterium]
MKILTSAEALAALHTSLAKKPRTYYAMYSSLFGGIVTDPALMILPLDDHMAHRGDAIFEALRCIDGHLYDADAHLKRLERSAEGIGLKLPVSLAELKTTMLATVGASEARSGIVRIFVSRGPGDFTPNPYTTIGSQLYIVYTAPAAYPERLYTEGATLGLSVHPAKPRPYCTIKSCNYLPNVLMRKEAVDRGLDFVVAATEDGRLTESSTENVALVTRERKLVAPPYADMLRGTTLERVMELVQGHMAEVGLKGTEQRELRVADFETAESALVIGTTLAVMPVKSFEGVTYTPAKDLPWLAPLMRLFQHDTLTNSARRTAVSFER